VIDSSSSLAFRSLLKTSVSRAGLNRPVQTLTGLIPPALALHVAAVAQDRPVVLIAASDADVDGLVSDTRFFLSAMLGLSERDATEAVLAFPSLEIDPYRALAPHLAVASARARALSVLATGTARVVIASARSLLPRVSDPARLAEVSLVIRPGVEISPQALGERLADAGFLPEDPVDEHGEFCVRGGVVDFFPASEAAPVRLEFIGDIIESVRRYDSATQRSQVALDRVTLTPQRELLDDPQAVDDPDRRDRSATFVDYVRRAGADLVVFEQDDVLDRVRALERQWRDSADVLMSRGKPAPPFEALAVDETEIASWLSSARHVSQLSLDDSGGTHVRQHPRWNIADASRTGRMKSAGCVHRTRRSCSLPRRRGGPNARSTSSRITRYAPARLARPTTSHARACSLRPGSCRVASTCRRLASPCLPKRTSSRKSDARTSAAVRQRQRSCPISAT
jgi:hypothetical protein